MLCGQLTAVKNRLKTAETELETSQEKVNKLAAEVEDFRKTASLSAIDVDNMQIVGVFTRFLFSYL